MNYIFFLKQLMATQNSLRGKLEILRENMKYKEAIVLSCGPSLNSLQKRQILDFAENKLLISIKEAFFKFPESHINLINSHRYPGSRHSYNNLNYENVIKIFSKGYTKNFEKNDYFDLKFQEIQISKSHETMSKKSLLALKNFKDFEFDKSLTRPWGPGIMFETVFYLLKFLNFTRIYILGWDLSIENDGIPHFFDNSNDKDGNDVFDAK